MHHNDQFITDIWKACRDGKISFEQAGQIQEHLSNRPSSSADKDHLRKITKTPRRRAGTHFPPRRHQVSPDRLASLEKRRGLGSRTEALIPEHIPIQFSEAKRAVLMVIAKELVRAACNLPIDKIAWLAGVCARTVQNTLAELKRFGLVRVLERRVPGGKSQTNIVTVVDAAWLKCVRRSIKLGCIDMHRPKAPRIFMHPTYKKDTKASPSERVEPRQNEAFRRETGMSLEPRLQCNLD
jgi:hypothetical protein